MNKKLLLLFGIAVFFICIIGANYGKNIPEKRQVQLFLDGYMGFEEPWNISYDPDGDYPSPARYWDVDGLCIYDHHYWSQLNYGYQHAGEYCAGVLPSNGSNGDLLQNEWIKTPWLNLSGYENVFLKFYGIWNWLNAPSDNDLYNVLISDNDIYWYPLLNILTLQEGTGGPAGYGWCWNEYQVVVDVCENITDLGLNPYHIKIAWQAYGGLNDTLHSMVTLDNIEIFEGNVHNINTNEWFPNITQAINDPETLDGHILEVYPGLYVENVIVWKKVTIRSKYGNPFNTTIIPLNITKPVIEIKVNNVTLSGFEIRGGNATFPPYGIKVDNASNCIINKNVIHLVQEGILLNSSNNRITNCSIFNNSLRGISLQSSFNNEITNCTVFNSNGYGILVFYSNNNTIINCIIGNNSIGGISSWFSSNNQIMNCTIYENSLYGIYLENSPNNIIKNNTFINDGLFLAGNLNAFIQNIDTTNIVNGKPLCYFLNKSNVVITGDVGELIMANCTEFLIQNINISNTDVAMEIAFSSYNQIKNCNIYNNYMDAGIYLLNCSNNNITDCIVHDNSWSGVYLSFSSFNRLTNCTIYNNFKYGIVFYESSVNYLVNCDTYNNSAGVSLSDCSVNSIMNCNIYNNSKGIWFFLYGHNNMVINCSIWNNSQGISICMNSSHNVIKNCSIYHNEIGINITGGWGNTIINCSVQGNRGIYLFFSFDNIIDGGTVSGGNSIYIENSLNTHITNCEIYGGGVYTTGILLQNSSSTNIERCNIYFSSFGIQLQNSHNNIINYSNIIGFPDAIWGIWLNYSSNNSISNCNISEFEWCCIYSQNSSYNKINKCNILATTPFGDGIDVFYSNNYIIQDCNVNEATWGIYFFSCLNGSINNCSVSDNSLGVYFLSSSNFEVDNCRIYNNSYGIYTINSSHIEILNGYFYGNAYGIKFSYSINSSVYNCGIFVSDNTGICAFNSSNIIVLNCFLQFYQTGIYLENSFNNKVIGCDIDGGIGKDTVTGILAYNSPNNYINACNIHDGCYGIKIRWYSDNNVINDCNLFGNILEGINITFSLNNEINNTEIKYNGIGVIIKGFNATSPPLNHVLNGCYIYYNDYGIEFYSTHNNLINNSKIFTNLYGIELYSSNFNIISSSEIYNNRHNGIYVVFSSDNLITNSYIMFNAYEEEQEQASLFFNFSDNNLVYNNVFWANAKNARDNGYNKWNITNQPGINIVGGPYLGGNFWDDYNGEDENGDGKGDTNLPYNCSGNIENGGDWHPLLPLYNHIYSGFLLHKGWNLITLPVENNYTASSLFNDIQGCGIILSWNSSVQDFIIYVPGSPYDFAIENGHGYFIGMSHDSIFSLIGNPVENVSVPLYIGWNILGWFKEEETTASSIYENITGCTIVLKWNNSKNGFDLYVPGAPNNFIIRRGDGFLVAVTEESIWHGEG